MYWLDVSVSGAYTVVHHHRLSPHARQLSAAEEERTARSVYVDSVELGPTYSSSLTHALVIRVYLCIYIYSVYAAREHVYKRSVVHLYIFYYSLSATDQPTNTNTFTRTHIHSRLGLCCVCYRAFHIKQWNYGHIPIIRIQIFEFSVSL